MLRYRIVYGDGEQVVREALHDIDLIEREDGFVVLFRGRDAILRMQEEHVQSLDPVEGS